MPEEFRLTKEYAQWRALLDKDVFDSGEKFLIRRALDEFLKERIDYNGKIPLVSVSAARGFYVMVQSYGIKLPIIKQLAGESD